MNRSKPDTQWEFPDFRIILFARSPASERIKTRLSRALDAHERRRLHCSMTRHVCATAVGARLCPVQLHVDGSLEHPFIAGLVGQLAVQCAPQKGRDLGERMFNAASAALQHSAGVVLVGSDCPFVDESYLRRAMVALLEHDAVIGPATDGGYVLLGIREPSPRLFQHVDWGTETVCSTTERRLRSLGWSRARLPPLGDIDRPEDLPSLANETLPADLRRFSEVCSV